MGESSDLPVQIFAVVIVKQKLTAYSKLSVFLLIAGAASLALRSNGDRPAGVSDRKDPVDDELD